jgi:hypothetical protein
MRGPAAGRDNSLIGGRFGTNAQPSGKVVAMINQLQLVDAPVILAGVERLR